jgi:hypothetical protein
MGGVRRHVRTLAREFLCDFSDLASSCVHDLPDTLHDFPRPSTSYIFPLDAFLNWQCAQKLVRSAQPSRAARIENAFPWWMLGGGFLVRSAHTIEPSIRRARGRRTFMLGRPAKLSGPSTGPPSRIHGGHGRRAFHSSACA